MSRARYHAWVAGELLPYWLRTGFDAGSGLFVEKLTLAGEPDRDAPLRVRTAFRQVYVFAHAAELGLLPRREALPAATAAAERLRAIAWGQGGRPGFAHAIRLDGTVVDDHRDLYDHAFALHGLAWLSKATGDPAHRALIEATLAYVDTTLASPAGGWIESEHGELPRRQNPHMHLFEAFLALFETTGEAHFLERADGLHALFETRFFDEAAGTLREFFGPDLELASGYGSELLDPGHMMEWVWLLRRYARARRVNVDRHCKLLFAAAERLGRDPASGFLVDQVDMSGRVTVAGRRLWPQTEYLKALVVETEAAGDASIAAQADAFSEALFATYLARPIPAGFIDRFDLAGRPIVDHIPASIVYHLLAPAVEIGRIGI